MNYESEVPRQIMRVKYRDELWELSNATNYELSTAMNYESEVQRRIMRVKYRDELCELSTATNYES